MNHLLDTTWKRLLVALLVAIGIYAAVAVFADSTYVETKKSQIETAAGQSCHTWTYEKGERGKEPVCRVWKSERR